MGANLPIKYDALPLASKRRIDRICLEFESAWKSRRRPSIELALGQSEEPERSALLEELLLLELDYRSRGHEQPSAEEYLARFPHDGELIGEVFQRSWGEEVTLDVFVQRLTESGLKTSEEVAAFLQGLPEDEKPTTAQQLAQQMVRRGELTPFQSEAVYQGKTEGLVLGNYVLLEKLGQGGMGQVYKAEHRKMERVVALKLLPASATGSPGAVGRFQREVKAAARLSHPNIVTAHDADEYEGLHFLVMEYVEGSDLSSLVRQHGPMGIGKAVDCIVQAATGLEYAHQQGIVHRDIKPANLLLDHGGTVKVLDMGLARLLESGAPGAQLGAELTHSGQVVGTLDYMPPEQAADTKQADTRADVYGLGCTLYYLLAGRAPFGGETLTQKILAHREDPVPSVREARPDVPEPLDQLIQQMLAKQPEDRPQTMGEVMARLEQFAAPSDGSGVPSPSAPAKESPVQDTLSPAGGALIDTAPQPHADEPPGQSGAERKAGTPRPAAGLLARSSRRQRVILGAAVAVCLFALFAAVIMIRLETTKGRIEVVAYDPDVEVIVKRNGEVIDGFHVKQRAGATSYLSGEYEIEIKGGKSDNVTIKNGKFKLTRGKRVLVEIFLAKDLAVSGAPSKTTEAQPPAARPTGDAPPPAVAPFDAEQAKAHQEAWAAHLGTPVAFTNSVGIEFRLIPPGEFLMGSTQEEVDDVFQAWGGNLASWHVESLHTEVPQHRVRLTKAFYLGVCELTRQQYQEVAGKALGNPSDAQTPQDAHAGLTWFAAVDFCDKLSEREGFPPYYRRDGNRVRVLGGRGYRLPTEAEWEHACRAGTRTRWSFGQDGRVLTQHAWGRGSSGGRTRRVRELTANPFGLFDVHGNLWEWCLDRGGSYPDADLVIDPVGPEEGVRRVLRGGGWLETNPICFRSAFRHHMDPIRGRDYGLRVARTITP